MDEETKARIYNDLVKKLMNDMVVNTRDTYLRLKLVGALDDDDTGVSFSIQMAANLLTVMVQSARDIGVIEDEESLLRVISDQLREGLPNGTHPHPRSTDH